MRKKRPQVATLDEVRISRDGKDAIIEFVDTTIATTHLKLGPQVQEMSDVEILDRFNAVILAQAQIAAEYEHVAVEVPVGSPQIRYFKRGDQWVPRGDVLRCVVESDEENEAVIYIDDHELTLQQFGRLLATYGGWGMRVVFVPDDDITAPPRIEVREPEDDGSGPAEVNGRPRRQP